MTQIHPEVRAEMRQWEARWKEQETTETPAEPAFCIDSEDRANWLLRKLANLDAEKERIQTQAETLLRQLESDRASLLHLYEAQLQAYVRARLEATGGRRKSLVLLQGTCAFRSVPPGLKLANQDAAERHAVIEEMSCFAYKFNGAAYRELAEERLRETGELLPGMETLEARESFSIRFGKKGQSEEVE